MDFNVFLRLQKFYALTSQHIIMILMSFESHLISIKFHPWILKLQISKQFASFFCFFNFWQELLLTPMEKWYFQNFVKV